MGFSIIKPLLTFINQLQLKSSTYSTVAPPLIRPHSLLQLKSGLIWGVTFLEGNSSVAFYYLSASEIWPGKKGGGGFGGWPGSYKRVTIENADAQIYSQNPGEWFSVGTSLQWYIFFYTYIIIRHQVHINFEKKYPLISIFITNDVCLFVCWMVFNTTFSNISVISWRSVLLLEETGGPIENHWPVASHWQTLSHNVCTPHPDRNSNSQHQWW